jgi:hypothetical protein
MSQLFRSSSKNQNSAAQAQKSEEMNWASDAVDRIARRTPALFKTNPVPSVQTRAMLTHMDTGGAS